MTIGELLARHPGAPVRCAITGASGDYARTVLAQCAQVPAVVPVLLCDLNLEGLARWLPDVGYTAFAECRTEDEVARAIASGAIALVSDEALVLPEHFDVLVEATGSPEFGASVARTALTAGRHVVMASKEVDSVAGPFLHSLAGEHGVVYSLAGGDQPANLLGLISWLRVLGFDIVAAGKSSECDLIWDPESQTVTQGNDVVPAPAMAEHFIMGDDVRETLRRRAEAAAELTRGATADFCEMAAVSTYSGLGAGDESMLYPVGRAAELADIYALREHGGIVRTPGVLDVFSAIRTQDEASVAGGVFAVVRTGDPVTWDILRGKGHVVSRCGRYACVYLPYHFMGVETVLSILAAARLGVGSCETVADRRVVLVGRATADLAVGSVLAMGGHHHDVTGVRAVLVEAGRAGGVAPLYLAARARLARSVRRGELIMLGDLEDASPVLAEAWSAAAG